MNDAQPIIIVTDPEDISDVECSELARAIAPIVLQDLQLGIPAEVPSDAKILVDAMYRAVDQLEGQGARSMRIARQLLEALARYELELGKLLLDEEEAPPALYRIEWCKRNFDGGEDMQEWKQQEVDEDKDVDLTDPYEAQAYAKRLNDMYGPAYWHRAVRVKP